MTQATDKIEIFFMLVFPQILFVIKFKFKLFDCLTRNCLFFETKS